MTTRNRVGFLAATGISAAGLMFLIANHAWAHCDTMRGPLIPEAQTALEKGDLTPILKWVKPEHEAEIKSVFQKSVAVRAKGAEARELADRYFLETLVRLHRAGEGAPYTGIRDEPVDPIIAMAEEALAQGSADEVTERIGAHLARALRERFDRVQKARARKNESVEAGREYVEAYVDYMHYVEGVHAAIASAGAHHEEAGAGAAAHPH